MRYRKGTSSYALCFEGNDNICLRRYRDANNIGDMNERKSTYEYASLLNNNSIPWNSKKKSCMALSAMKVEFSALSSAVQEVI